jgi:hypothetical protein
MRTPDTVRVDGRTATVSDVVAADGITAALVDTPSQWATLVVIGPGDGAEVYELADPATVVASQHALARARIADEDAFWAAHGDPDAVIGELVPAATPPTTLATLVHDDFLATDRLMAGVLYDLDRREYWIVRAVKDVPAAQLLASVSRT